MKRAKYGLISAWNVALLIAATTVQAADDIPWAGVGPPLVETAQQDGDAIKRQTEPEDILEATAKGSTTYPYLDIGVLVEVQNDHVYDSDDPGAEINDLFTKTEPVFALHILPGLFVEAALVLEPVFPPMPFEDRFFGDQGLFVEVLALNYEGDNFTLVGGKFTPNFGIAWDLAPGIYGPDFAEDYELTERIGGGGSWTFADGAFGSHAVSASSFFLDTSLLSDSLITERGRTERADGGPSNTGDLSSFAMALDGGNVGGVDGLAYHVGFAYQGVSQPGEDTELGFVVGGSWSGDLGGGVAIEPIVEFAYFENADGVMGQDRSYLTTGVGLGYADWGFALSYTGRTTTESGRPEIDDRLVQVSAGYAFENGFILDAGWAWMREDNIDNYRIGVLLTYEFGFCIGCTH